MLISNLSLAGLAVVTARLLGPSHRGILVLVMTVAAVSMLGSSFGTPFPARRMLGQRPSKGEIEAMLGLFLCLVTLQGLSAITILPLLLRIAEVTLSGLGLGLAVSYAIAMALAMYARESLYGLGRNGQAAGYEALGSVTQLALVIVVLKWSRAPTAQLALGAMVVGNLIQFVLQIVSFSGVIGTVRPRFQWRTWLGLLKTGVSGFGFSAGQLIAIRGDRYLLALYTSTATVGVYSVAATAGDYLWLAPFAISQVLFHSVASGDVGLQEVRRMHRLVVALSVALAGILYMAAPFVIVLVFGVEYTGAVTPLRVILFGSVAFGSFQVSASTLAAAGSLGRAGISATVGALVLVVASLVVIPTYGALGAAYASVVSYWLMAIVSYWNMRRVVR